LAQDIFILEGLASMGCGGSKGADAPGPGSDSPSRVRSASEPQRTQSNRSQASIISETELKVHHDRLRKLQELDGATKIPFILVELRGIGHGHGFIEVCGKDEYGVYHALNDWALSTMKCKKLDAGTLDDDTPLPFCDALYQWDGFMVDSADGTNNMGLATMQLVEFMCRKLCWTLGVINGGNVGKSGEIREQQIIFKAPHPMNMVAHHLMIELRSTGYIEVCGSDRDAKDALHDYFVKEMSATPKTGHQDWSDRYYHCPGNVFKERGKSGENNLGKLTTQVCDAVVSLLPGWTLVTMNGGNYGEGGTHREQQLVFRCDNHPLSDACHLLVELREAGYIEICGQDVNGMHDKVIEWAKSTWGCSKADPSLGQEPFCDKKLKWKPKDMMVASAELTNYFHLFGWQMVVCSQGTVAVKGNAQSREQQIIFRPGASGEGVVEPHLFIELYTGEGTDKLYAMKEQTQVLSNQFIRIREVGDCRAAVKELEQFIENYLGGTSEPDSDEWKSFCVDVFLARGITDNNLGCWTMRICDFMVDRLGWSFVVCNVCNLGPYGNYREQQMVFRYDGERREIPPVKADNRRLDETLFVGVDFPDYWREKKVMQLKQPTSTVSCTKGEIRAMQDIFDHTFKRVLTRDRVYEYQLNVNEEMPYRLDIVHMFRCEDAELYRRFQERRSTYKGGTPCRPKTRDQELKGAALLNDRLGEGEAFLAHGTNPSSAMGILKSGFSLAAAGKSTGTMFGYGIYLAECVSKSDEYARDDNGGTYPGLMAILMCRTLVGNPYVVQDAGDYIQTAKEQGCDCVVGDRESKVGTYKEFIFFDQRQVLPEYAVIYKRQYDKTKVHEKLRMMTRGTTGRNWQLKLQKGWADLTPDVSWTLNKAEGAGETSVQHKINDVLYEFNFGAMEQRNVDTGTTRKIRPPMRR